jgi:hypothetical protein
MGDVGSVYLAAFAYALAEVDQEEGDSLHEEELDGIRVTFEEDVEFHEFEDEDILNMAEEVASIFKEHLMCSLFSMRDVLREGAELADVYDMYENQEPDWEV